MNFLYVKLCFGSLNIVTYYYKIQIKRNKFERFEAIFSYNHFCNYTLKCFSVLIYILLCNMKLLQGML